MRIEEIGPSEAVELWLGALHGAPALARERERLSLSDEEDSLVNAQRLRPVILAAVDTARKGAGERD
jgi:hypothetical protein